MSLPSTAIVVGTSSDVAAISATACGALLKNVRLISRRTKASTPSSSGGSPGIDGPGWNSMLRACPAIFSRATGPPRSTPIGDFGCWTKGAGAGTPTGAAAGADCVVTSADPWVCIASENAWASTGSDCWISSAPSDSVISGSFWRRAGAGCSDTESDSSTGGDALSGTATSGAGLDGTKFSGTASSGISRISSSGSSSVSTRMSWGSSSVSTTMSWGSSSVSSTMSSDSSSVSSVMSWGSSSASSSWWVPPPKPAPSPASSPCCPAGSDDGDCVCADLSAEPESPVSAQAGFATAVPIPSARARAPTRPTCFAYPMIFPPFARPEMGR